MGKHVGMFLLVVMGWSCVTVIAQAVKQQPAVAATLTAVTEGASVKPATSGAATAAAAATMAAAATSAVKPAATTPAATAAAATPAVKPAATAPAALPAAKAVTPAVTPLPSPSKTVGVPAPAVKTPAVVAQPTVTLKPTAAVPTKVLPAAPAAPAAAVPPPFIFKQPGATRTIKIGCAVPFEGDKASVGAAVLAGLVMAIKAQAPILVPNANVNLTCLNSKCVDIPAYMAVTRFAEEKADAVVGEICSGASVAAAGVANAKKLLVISPSSTSPALSQIDYFFRTVPSDRYQGVAAAKLVYTNGGRSAGLVYEDSSYGYGLAFNFIAGFTKLGGNVPVVYQFKPTQGNPADAVAKLKQGIKDNKLDAVFISTNNLTFTAEVLVQAKAAGLTNLKYYAGDSQADVTLLQRIGGRPSVVGQLTATSPSYGSDAFVKQFAQFTGSSKVPYSPFAAHAYDAMEALLRAFKAAPAAKDGTVLKAALQSQKFEGVSGPIEFDSFGDLVPAAKSYVYSRFDLTRGTVGVQGSI